MSEPQINPDRTCAIVLAAGDVPAGRVTRIREFLDHLDLTHLLVTQPEDSNTPATWDVGHTSRLIETARSRGTKFLHDALTPSP